MARTVSSADSSPQGSGKFTFQPTRTLLFSIIFTALVMWQSGFDWWWAIPIWFFIWAIFILGHSFYNWANLKLIELGRRNKEAFEDMEREEKLARKRRGKR